MTDIIQMKIAKILVNTLPKEYCLWVTISDIFSNLVHMFNFIRKLVTSGWRDLGSQHYDLADFGFVSKLSFEDINVIQNV